MATLLGGWLVLVAPGAGLQAADIALRFLENAQGQDGVQAQLQIPATPDLIWRVLTDYNHLHEFVPDLVVSRVIGSQGGDLILYQQGQVRILFYVFRTSVTLRIQEEPYRRIQFSQIDGDFRYFYGNWLLEPTSDGLGTVVTYTLWAHPRFYAPRWLMRWMLERDLPKRLRAVEARIQTLLAGEGP